MATIGNLEMRLFGKTLQGATTHDGNRAYHIIEKLSEYLNSNPRPNPMQYAMWFNKTAKELLPYQPSKELIGGVPCEVIIDSERRILLYNAGPEDSTNVKKEAILNLQKRHKYQIFRYKHNNQL